MVFKIMVWRQHSLLPELKRQYEHGGALLKGKRKARRPFDRKKWLHVVFRAEGARGKYSFMHPTNRKKGRTAYESFRYEMASAWSDSETEGLATASRSPRYNGAVLWPRGQDLVEVTLNVSPSLCFTFRGYVTRLTTYTNLLVRVEVGPAYAFCKRPEDVHELLQERMPVEYTLISEHKLCGSNIAI